jgi:hypothetical protein
VKRVRVFAATVPAAVGLAMPTALGLAMPTAANATNTVCWNPQNSTSCITVHGTGLYVSSVNLSFWPNANGGVRHGYLGWYNSATHRYVSQWHVASEYRDAHLYYSFKWTLNCYMESHGWISGRVGGHPGKPKVTVEEGPHGTPHCVT